MPGSTPRRAPLLAPQVRELVVVEPGSGRRRRGRVVRATTRPAPAVSDPGDGRSDAAFDRLGAPHRRYDPLLDEWVLVSAGRTRRPWHGSREQHRPERPPPYDPNCYLCPGNMRANGERNPDYPRTFVFTNDFAALRPDSPIERNEDGLLRAEGERGTSRVLCFSPRHDLTLAGMAAGGRPARGRHVGGPDRPSSGERYRWVQVFENRGAEMGASNPHPHGQIWAGSALPREAAARTPPSARYHASGRRRLLLDYVGAGGGGPRVVEENADWLVGGAVLGRLAVRDAAHPARAGAAAAGPRRRRSATRWRRS